MRKYSSHWPVRLGSWGRRDAESGARLAPVAVLTAITLVGALVSGGGSADYDAGGSVEVKRAAAIAVANTPMARLDGSVTVEMVAADGEALDLPITLERLLAMLERAERFARSQNPELPQPITNQAAEFTMMFGQFLSGEAAASFADVANTAIALAVALDPVTAPGTSFAEYVAPFEPGADAEVMVAGPEVTVVTTATSRRPDYPPAVALAEQASNRLDPRAATWRPAGNTMKVRVQPVSNPVTLPSVATPFTDMLRGLVATWDNSMTGLVNGALPPEVLCALPFAPNHRLRCDAAAAFTQLNEAFQVRWGRSIPLTDSYRTFEGQVRARLIHREMAAIPGRSMHGWGLAVDLGRPLNTGHGAEYAWMLANAPAFGWDLPAWARPGGILPEPWHWEFVAAGSHDRPPTPEQVAYWAAVQGDDGAAEREAQFQAELEAWEREMAEWEAAEAARIAAWEAAEAERIRQEQEAWEREQAGTPGPSPSPSPEVSPSLAPTPAVGPSAPPPAADLTDS